MTTLTHTLFGIVLAKVSVDTGLFPASSSVIYPISVIAANLPDFDVLFIPMTKNHRESILHMPLFWMINIVLCYIGAWSIHKELLPYVHILTIGVTSHFLFDSFDMRSGIRWLYPFNKKFFNVLHSADTMRLTTKVEFIKLYVTHPVMIAEGTVLFVILLAFLKL